MNLIKGKGVVEQAGGDGIWVVMTETWRKNGLEVSRKRWRTWRWQNMEIKRERAEAESQISGLSDCVTLCVMVTEEETE